MKLPFTKFTKKHIIIYTICFILFLILLSYRIGGPWVNRHDDNGAVYSAYARTHILRGLSKTRGQDFRLLRANGKMVPYLHHPPLLGLYLAGVFYLTGHDSSLVARSAMAFLHTLSFIIFFLIVKMLFQEEHLARFWAILVFAITPMSIYFGKMPNHEPISLLFLLCGVHSYLRYMNDTRLASFWLFVGAISWFLAIFSSWHAIFVITGLIIHAVCFRREGTSRFAIMSLVCLVAASALVIIQIFWASNWQFLADQKRAMLHWLIPQHGKFCFGCLFKGIKFTRDYFGFLPPIFTAFWLFGLLFRKIKSQTVSRMHLFVASLAIGTVLYSLIFSASMEPHPYQQFYLLPFIAISSAMFIADAYKRIALDNKELAIYFVAISILMTAILSLEHFSRVYSTISPYAIKISSECMQTFY